MRTAILIVSTAVSGRHEPDVAGPVLASLAEDAGAEVVTMEVVPDDYALIEDRLHHFVEGECDLILTAGGIGADLVELTPDATRSVMDRDAPGVAEAIRAADPGLLLTRGTAGWAADTLIVNLPGDAEAAGRAFAVVAPLIARA